MHMLGGTAASRVRSTTRVVIAAVVVAAVSLAGPATGAMPPAAHPGSVVAGLDSTAAALAGLRDAPAAPVLPGRSLTAEIVALSRLLGTPLAERDVAAAVAQTRIAPDTRVALAILLARLNACAEISRQLVAASSLAGLARNPEPASQNGLGACATDLAATTAAARAILNAPRGGEDALVLWPVISYAPDESSDDVYREDFALLVDRGGNDRYFNNQGGSMLDLKRSVTNPAARIRRAARGCEAVFPDATTGRLKRGPMGERVMSYDGAECSPGAALLLDLSGHDRYGRKAKPGFPDNTCTPDRIVRRISTIGSGVAGVGMLIDEAGDDVYLGKTGTQGAGHLGGVGVLEDHAGDDNYHAIRGGQGLGLLGGIGVLRDRGGNDRYGFRMPRPLDPDAPNHSDGAGGVVDDTGLGSEAGLAQQPDSGVGGTCDRLRRSLQGVGLLAGAGILVDDAGADVYRAPLYLNQPFFTLQGATIHLAHGSQGSGYLGGAGVLADLDGRDRYRSPSGRPSKTRGDGAVIGPRVDASTDNDAPANGKPVDLSVFYDSGP